MTRIINALYAMIGIGHFTAPLPSFRQLDGPLIRLKAMYNTAKVNSTRVLENRIDDYII